MRDVIYHGIVNPLYVIPWLLLIHRIESGIDSNKEGGGQCSVCMLSRYSFVLGHTFAVSIYACALYSMFFYIVGLKYSK